MEVKELMMTLLQQLKQLLLQLQIERKEYILNPNSPLLQLAGIIVQLEMAIQELPDLD